MRFSCEIFSSSLILKTGSRFKKPAYKKASRLIPLRTNAVIILDTPGTISISKSFCIASFIKKPPGSANRGVPQSEINASFSPETILAIKNGASASSFCSFNSYRSFVILISRSILAPTFLSSQITASQIFKALIAR